MRFADADRETALSHMVLAVTSGQVCFFASGIGDVKPVEIPRVRETRLRHEDFTPTYDRRALRVLSNPLMNCRAVGPPIEWKTRDGRARLPIKPHPDSYARASPRFTSSSLKHMAAPYYPEEATSVMLADRDFPVTLRMARARFRGLGLTIICTSRSSALR